MYFIKFIVGWKGWSHHERKSRSHMFSVEIALPTDDNPSTHRRTWWADFPEGIWGNVDRQTSPSLYVLQNSQSSRRNAWSSSIFHCCQQNRIANRIALSDLHYQRSNAAKLVKNDMVSRENGSSTTDFTVGGLSVHLRHSLCSTVLAWWGPPLTVRYFISLIQRSYVQCKIFSYSILFLPGQFEGVLSSKGRNFLYETNGTIW